MIISMLRSRQSERSTVQGILTPEDNSTDQKTKKISTHRIQGLEFSARTQWSRVLTQDKC